MALYGQIMIAVGVLAALEMIVLAILALVAWVAKMENLERISKNLAGLFFIVLLASFAAILFAAYVADHVQPA